MMKKVSVNKLSKNTFDKYGSYADVAAPEGPCLGEPPYEFYRDMALLNMGSPILASPLHGPINVI